MENTWKDHSFFLAYVALNLYSRKTKCQLFFYFQILDEVPMFGIFNLVLKALYKDEPYYLLNVRNQT